MITLYYLRFFRLLGPVFGFVSKDLEDKISTLQKHLTGQNGESYKTLETMTTYEVQHNLQKSKPSGLQSGSRTILRLHRALEFIIAFINRLCESNSQAKTSVIASSVYHVTLAHHHIWLLRKMAAVAMYTLPTRKVLIESLCKHGEEEALALAQQVVCEAKPVYDHMQKVLESKKLLNLP